MSDRLSIDEKALKITAELRYQYPWIDADERTFKEVCRTIITDYLRQVTSNKERVDAGSTYDAPFEYGKGPVKHEPVIIEPTQNLEKKTCHHSDSFMAGVCTDCGQYVFPTKTSGD